MSRKYQVSGAKCDVLSAMCPVSRHTFHVLLVALLLAACAPANTGPQPPEILYGQDVCEECGMIISEARFACAALFSDGEMRKYDDIGDMLAFAAKHADLSVGAWFVHDYNSEQWMRGETAFFVLSDQIRTPMNRGIAAFKDQADAEAFAAQVGAPALTFDALRVKVH